MCGRSEISARNNVMSYYYNYYVGQKRDGKIYPWGPYTASGKLLPVLSKSRSCASELHQRFHKVSEAQVSDELRERFEEESLLNPKVKIVNVKYLPVDDLPKGSFVKSGYFPIEEVMAYESDDSDDYFDGFSRPIPPHIYAAMFENQRMLGAENQDRNAADYMFYAYPDFNSEEYEADVLREAAEMLKTYMEPEGTEFVILETEG